MDKEKVRALVVISVRTFLESTDSALVVGVDNQELLVKSLFLIPVGVATMAAKIGWTITTRATGGYLHCPTA